MFVAEGLKPDIDNDGWVKGWGVVRNCPLAPCRCLCDERRCRDKSRDVGRWL